MPQITRIKMTVLFLLGLLAIAGCGDPNSQASFNVDRSTHIKGWLPSNHVTQANQNMGSCTECHGADYSGGMSGVACVKCHLGDEAHVHPIDWVDIPTTLTKHRQYVVANGDNSCRNVSCHGLGLEGVAGSGPSCNACHSYP